MTTYERLIRKLGEGLGIELGIGAGGIVEVAVEERVVLLKPQEGDETLTIFTVAATAPEGEKFTSATLEKALSLNLFGNGTLGGHLGLFINSLILSASVSMAELNAEDLAERLLVFARFAEKLAKELQAEEPGITSDAGETAGQSLTGGDPLQQFSVGNLLRV